jgi:hypothetical protein
MDELLKLVPSPKDFGAEASEENSATDIPF